jgi:hypothetical protein
MPTERAALYNAYRISSLEHPMPTYQTVLHSNIQAFHMEVFLVEWSTEKRAWLGGLAGFAWS